MLGVDSRCAAMSCGRRCQGGWREAEISLKLSCGHLNPDLKTAVP